MNKAINLLKREIENLEISILNNQDIYKETRSEKRRILAKEIIHKNSKLIEEYENAIKILSNEREAE